jgi:pyrrolidone-carboxylate peptidase
MEQEPVRPEEWGTLARVSLGAGSFVVAVSVGLFMHTISQLSSPLVCAGFIAAGVVGRRRASTAMGQALAVGAIVGGLAAAIASIALAAAGR